MAEITGTVYTYGSDTQEVSTADQYTPAQASDKYDAAHWYSRAHGRFVMSREDRNDAFVLYNKIFADDGSVQPCGRETCKDLIRVMTVEFPGEDFGNLSTGMMNVENIRKYIAQMRTEDLE